MRLRIFYLVLSVLLLCAVGCATAPPEPQGPTPLESALSENQMLRVQMEERAQKLMQTTDALRDLEGNLDEQRRRLRNICVDYPEHQACSLHQAAAFAYDTFCKDEEFTAHVDGVVSACQRGQCKQVDDASLLSRSNYMTLVQRLPHSLVTFKAGRTRLDRKDRMQLQQFLENIEANRGYVIVVGRASKDGSWKKNLRLALDRAENTRSFLVNEMGLNEDRVGYITYGHEKMYITELDAQRLSEKKMSTRQANRSALVFTYPCYEGH